MLPASQLLKEALDFSGSAILTFHVFCARENPGIISNSCLFITFSGRPRLLGFLLHYFDYLPHDFDFLITVMLKKLPCNKISFNGPFICLISR